MVNQQTTDDRSRNLSTDDLAALRANLHEQRQFRQEQLQQLSATATTRADASPDRGDTSRTEVCVSLAASAVMVLSDVEAALTRMDQDTYGTCQLCRGTVALERLMIVPQARYCARCQQVREADR
ncbi:TraR/DksA C4-type zinc finger protein [Streptomyces sp. NPDC093272]|uniref:TraR/DksA family transcriptional regulator n=1 Tax=Streptomyces sp. NPDC093272 TaxID=3154981 RepID=UPI0034123B89